VGRTGTVLLLLAVLAVPTAVPAHAQTSAWASGNGLLSIPGTAVLGLSRRDDPPDRTRDLIGVAQALGMEAELVGVDPEILESPAWLLIMRLGV